MPNNFSALANADGSAVDIKITQANGVTAAMPVPIHEVGYAAAGLLAGAVDCARKSGKLAQLAKKIDPSKLQHKYLKAAHAVALSDASDDPKLVVLIFAIGGTEMAIGIPREILATLGKSLMAASASGPKN